MNKEKIPPIHPGDILKEEFLDEMGITQYKLSKENDFSSTSFHFNV